MFLQTIPGRTCIINDTEYLFCSGYGYLGMSHLEGFIHNVVEGMRKYGTVFPSSRNSNTQFVLFDEMEMQLSRLTAQEESVIFSSGFLAGQTIAEVLSHKNNIVAAPGTHPAIRLNRMNIPGISFPDWCSSIIQTINDSSQDEWIIFADSVNIISGMVHDFSFLQRLSVDKRITILIDDSHGIGILGKAGEGIISLVPKKENIEYIISYSLSKAFNIPGGAVSASSSWCDLLRSHPNYSGSTSISPATAFAFMESQRLYATQRSVLLKNIALLSEAININVQEKTLPIFPCGKNIVQQFFLDRGIVISSFHYPFPNSDLVERIVINALHTPEDISKIAGVFNEVCGDTF